MDRKYLIIGFVYAILGMALGIVMSATRNHGQMPTHAHILLVGFVMPFAYAVCYRLWAAQFVSSRLATIQFYAHQLGVLLMVVGLFSLYGGLALAELMMPLMPVAAILVLIAAVLMLVQIVRAPAQR